MSKSADFEKAIWNMVATDKNEKNDQIWGFASVFINSKCYKVITDCSAQWLCLYCYIKREHSEK